MYLERRINTLIYYTLGFVMCMILLGGITRLTGSGLSITEWNVLSGILPPITSQDWNHLFEKYQQTPEFAHVNFTFSLRDFQNIFWLEYLHRLWGRLLVVPLGIFTWNAYKSPFWKPFYRSRIRLIWFLGTTQGWLGWLMVKSGLGFLPYVSPFRLSFHLLMTGGIVFTLCSMIRSGHYIWVPNRNYIYVPLGILSITIFYGALVAGFKAGFIYNTFPTMGGQWVPENVMILQPLWQNFFMNTSTIQFIHRLLGTMSLFALLYLGAQIIHIPSRTNWKFGMGILSLGILQYGLGITTLLTGVQIVPATLHQMVAFWILGLLSWAFWRMRIYTIPEKLAAT